MAKPQKEASVDEARAAFHERMHANHMYGLWELASQMTPHPQPKMIPYMWPWSRLKSIVDESGAAVPVGEERRALQLFNPGLDGRCGDDQQSHCCSTSAFAGRGRPRSPPQPDGHPLHY